MHSIQWNQSLFRRVRMVCVGVFLMGFFIAVFVYANLGSDPCTVMNLGVSGKLGIPFGVWQLIVNCVILIFTFSLSRNLIGIGTVVNMVSIGFLVDFFRMIFARILPAAPALWLRILLMAVAVVGLSLTAALYMYPQLGISPYDSVPVVLAQKTGIQFRWCRVFWDLLAMLIGWLCGSVVGVGTVITAFFLGPLIKYFTNQVARKAKFQVEAMI